MPFDAYLRSEPFGTLTEADQALKTATQLIHVIAEAIRKANPQLHLPLGATEW